MFIDRIDLTLAAEDRTAATTALTTAESKLTGLVLVSNQDRKRLAKMGLKNGELARRIIELGKANPDVLPRGLDMAKIERDLAAHEQLVPMLYQSKRLTDHLADTTLLLGVDIYSAALTIYGSLKRNANTASLKSSVADISKGFSRTRKAKAEPTPDPLGGTATVKSVDTKA